MRPFLSLIWKITFWPVFYPPHLLYQENQYHLHLIQTGFQVKDDKLIGNACNYAIKNIFKETSC